MVLKILLPIVTWLPTVFFWVVFVLTAGAYLKRHSVSLKSWVRRLIAVAVSYYLVYAALSTMAQYYAFKAGELTKKFLDMPLNQSLHGVTFWMKIPFIANSRLGYFVLYSWEHFWFPALLSILAGLVFWAVLKALGKYKERFFEDGEVELGALAALLVGWPNFIIFVPAVFLSIVIISVIRMAFFEESYTTLGIPLLLAVLLTYIFSSELASLLVKLNP